MTAVFAGWGNTYPPKEWSVYETKLYPIVKLQVLEPIIIIYKIYYNHLLKYLAQINDESGFKNYSSQENESEADPICSGLKA